MAATAAASASSSSSHYNLLNPVIALTITDFIMFADLPNVTSSFILKEKDFLIDYPIYDIELIFVELPKFKKDLAALETIIDKWLFFLTNARKLKDVPDTMDNIPELKKAFYIANQANLNLDELEEQEKSEIFIQDQRGAITKAARESLEQGRQEGLTEGLQQKTNEIAKKMLGSFDEQTIAHITVLTLDEIRAMQS